MPNDYFQSMSGGLESPAAQAVAITTSNTADLSVFPRALYATTAGTVRVTMMEGGAIVTLPILVGVPLPVRVRRVWTTGTTASGIVGVW
ncbi:spike base protein, RCAP_Rcc01079 family [Ketogulonicigenium vulgare]|uniref:Uncharacterized protein n=1 Tax=Ketogulonicigenium vulgare (strain WSH-001) TaxID=759362 RepID=F9Y982_KETVW|nr:hypothetical protein [Ketogulonicigenium vulgare]ADO41577.1 conserved hypothetical protein [Ketogulonicigenium vulgare Y25]AEM41299.1 hypothetical protein KVU_1460 [Ketogulonicigenium vulgare WSH-001]ALJ81434.1 hypothetical protein KVH_09750 [Ketogulonicigenium vulgare]ANW35086.1 hypothetical protein KvSKV_09695 [Ketogulonicigenium vulgare]AOZ55032.1 hypothetical protein KVC_2025 [Ketogulonicigenium vulgare]